jgi:hypothetical protein
VEPCAARVWLHGVGGVVVSSGSVATSRGAWWRMAHDSASWQLAREAPEAGAAGVQEENGAKEERAGTFFS